MTATLLNRIKPFRHAALGVWPMVVGVALLICLFLLFWNQFIYEHTANALKLQVELQQKNTDLGEVLQIEKIQQLEYSLKWLHVAMALMVAITCVSLYILLGRVALLRREDERKFTAAVMEHARLEALVTERSESLATLATHLQHVREEERGFLARELHDELGALLTAAKFDVARVKAKLENQDFYLALERLSHLNATLNSGIALKRRMVENLRPSSLDNLGLVAALEILAREFSEGSHLPVRFQLEEVSLSNTSALTAYRLVQESLTNIAKHAQAKAIFIQLSKTDTGANLVVEDDGIGFDASRVKPNSHGLAGMQHRVTSAGGQLRIGRRDPESGTRVEAFLPACPLALQREADLRAKAANTRGETN